MPRKVKEEKDMKTEEPIDTLPKPEVYEKIEVQEIPTLIKPDEFLQLMSKEYPVESMGGFIYWMKKQGMPPKWPLKMWKAKLDEYFNRKL